MKTHPRAGVDLLDGSQWNPLVKAVVLRHHERWNGSGYPDGKAGEEIHQMARIAAVADVFDADHLRPRLARRGRLQQGVRAIREGSGTLFDPDVAESFCRVVAPFPPGTPIELTDGRSGIVVSVPRGAPSTGRSSASSPSAGSLRDLATDDPGLVIVGWQDAPAPTAAR